MRDLTLNELDEVSGGEILVSPGQIGVALTDNTLVVITGTAEASGLLGAFGAGMAAGSFGYQVGSAIVEYTEIEHWLGGLMYTMSQCFR